MVDICENASNFCLYNDVLYQYWDNVGSFSSHQNMLQNPSLLHDWLISNKKLMDKLKKRKYTLAYSYSKAEVLKISYIITKAVDFEGIDDPNIYDTANLIVNNYKKYINKDFSFQSRVILFLRRYNRGLYNWLMLQRYKKRI